MKNYIVGLIVLYIVSVCNSQTYWKRKYGGSSYDSPVKLLEISDNQKLLAARSQSFGLEDGIWLLYLNDQFNIISSIDWGGVYSLREMISNTDSTVLLFGERRFGATNRDTWINGVDKHGNALWTKTYGGAYGEHTKYAFPLSDTSTLIIGESYSLRNNNGDLLLMNVNSQGDTLWTKRYWKGVHTRIPIVYPLPNKHFLIATMVNVGGSEEDTWLLKINSDGDTLWTQTYSEGFINAPLNITRLNDNNFLITGRTQSSQNDSYDISVRKIDSSGNLIWRKVFGGDNWDEAKQVEATKDGGAVIFAWSMSFSNRPNIWLFKISNDGDTLWSKVYGGNNDDVPMQVLPFEDDSYLIFAYTESIGNGKRDIWLLRINSNGNILWSKTWGDTQHQEPIFLQRLNNGTFILGANTTDTFGNADIWLINIIPDQYANNNVPFSYKIPVLTDTINYIFLPSKVPGGMTVANDGTISWLPQTDSIYIEQVEFMVSNDQGITDTLGFNIFVNDSGKNIPTPIIKINKRKKNKSPHKKGYNTIYPLDLKIYGIPNNKSMDGFLIYNLKGINIAELLPSQNLTGYDFIWKGSRKSPNDIKTGLFLAAPLSTENLPSFPIMIGK